MQRLNSKILIVDDTVSSSVMLKTMLNKMGFNKVDIAKNKEESFRLTTKNSYEVILMDYHLSDELNGVTLFITLKEKGYISEYTSCIMISNDKTRNAVLNTIDSGINSFIFKPYTKGTIEERVLSAQKDYSDLKYIYKEIKKDKETGYSFFLETIDKREYSNNIKLKLISEILAFNSKEIIERIEKTSLRNMSEYLLYKIKQKENKTEEWIDYLRNFSKENKLLIEAKELLLEKEIERGNNSEAIELMKEIIETMPSNTNLLIKISKMAIKLNNKEILFLVGDSMFDYFQKYKKDWLSNISIYLYNVSVYIEKNKKDLDNNILLLEKFKKKINDSDFSNITKVDLLRQIEAIISKIYIRTDNKILGKRRLLFLIKRDENRLNKIPTETLILYMYLISELKETKLFITLYKEYKERKYFSLYVRIKQKELKEANLIKTITGLENSLNKAKFLLKEKKYKEALYLYEKIKKDCPYSSEVSLGLINSLILSNKDVQIFKLKESYANIENMPLFGLQNWNDSIIHPVIKKINNS
tara:strand:+ start:10197 stop:11786 length:1590 start_codon:yes stop_codon:yes gene_type:complete